MHDCSLLLWQHASFIKLMSRCNAWWVKKSPAKDGNFESINCRLHTKMVEHAYRQQCCASRLYTDKSSILITWICTTSVGFDGLTSAVSHEFSCKDLKWYNTYRISRNRPGRGFWSTSCGAPMVGPFKIFSLFFFKCIK